MPIGPTTAMPLTAIAADGTPVVFAPEGSRLLRIPQGIADARQIGATPGAIIALDGSGRLHAWGTSPPLWMPSEPVVDLATSSYGCTAVLASGEVVGWTAAGQIAVHGLDAPVRRHSLALGWGVALTASGESRCFSIGNYTAPSLPILPGVEEVSAAGSASSARAIALLADGGIRSLHSAFSAAGPFTKAQVTTSKVLALDAAGHASYWAFVPATGDYATEPTGIPGVFDDIAAPDNSSVTHFYGICSADADRNGEPDLDQIRRGEIPDVNGDSIDDRVQDGSTLFDDDLNGVVDAIESASIAGRHGEFAYLWYWMSPQNYRLSFFALDRVPPQAEAPRRAELSYVSKHHGQYGVPPGGMPARYAIFLDPNGDGEPSDAVQLGSWDIVLEDDGAMSIDLGRIWIGPPGTVFWHGLSWNRPLAQTPALLPAQVPPPNALDPFRVSRNRSRSWGGAWPLADAPTSAVGEMRLNATFEEWNVGSQIPAFALTWGDRLPTDCDGDGLLDSQLVGAGGNPWWAPESDPDLDDNGFVDRCEVDCDLNGVVDAMDIMDGSLDCNRDLVPDVCSGTVVRFAQDSAFPSFDSPVYIGFRNLPPALGVASLRIDALGDLGDLDEALLVRIGDGPDEFVFEVDGSDCPTVADSAALTIDGALLNAAMTGGMLQIRIGATATTNAADCPVAFVRATLEYPSAATDCDGNGVPDGCEHGYFEDCDGNGMPDACQLADPGADADHDGVLDACQLDCDRNGVPDRWEIAEQPARDCDASGYLDACEMFDCNRNGLNDACEPLAPGEDCNGDGKVDACQVLPDCNSDGVPDACETDCDGNGISDLCELQVGGTDTDLDGVLDACEYLRGDFNLDGFVSASDMPVLLNLWGASGNSIADLNRDGIVSAQDLAAMLANWGNLRY